MKTCTKCGEEKGLNEFHRCRGKKDGRHGHCKPCRCTATLAYAQTTRGRATRRTRREARRLTARGRATNLHRNTKCRAKKKGICFNLGKDWIEIRMLAGYCEITGVEFDFTAATGPFSPSIDRVESGGGYTEENCRVVCWVLNAAMNDWGLDPVLKLARALLEQQK